MKKTSFGRSLALLLCLALVMSVPALAASTLGDDISGYETEMVQGVELAQGVYWTGGDYRTENYVERAADSPVYPITASWDTLCSYGSLSAMAAKLEEAGLHVIAGINGDYYNTTTGVPVGIVVQGGVLRSSCDGLNAVGFREDGSAVFGKPALDMKLNIAGTSYPLQAVNKARGDGFVLFTDDFAATTKNTGKGWDVICTLSEDLPLNGTVTLTVEEVLESDGALRLPEDRVVLSLSEEADDWRKEAIQALTPGQQITLDIRCAEGWEDVSWAVGNLYKLVTDGKVETGLEIGAAPRTAIGVKADGTLVLYTIDGRQSGYSIGATMAQVAQRLIELGCVDAGVLDGGGSTNLSAVYPGDSALSQVNKPSDGSARQVVNYILLVTEAKPTGAASRLALYPLTIHALSGAEVELTVKAADANGYSAAVPAQVTYGVDSALGEIQGNVFHAAGAGTGTITAAASGVETASVKVQVVETPDELSVYGEVYGLEVTALTLEPGQVVNLTARAKTNHVTLTAQDTCFTWSLESAAGTVDETGKLTASETEGSGVLTVSAGQKSVQIPIVVKRPVPFDDVQESDWFYEAVKYVYENELFSGTGESTFEPKSTMNRAMLATVLWRMAGSPQTDAASPFADVPADAWYADAVSWAAAAGVVNGVSETEFHPADPLTREQIAAMLCRYYTSVQGGTAESGDLSAFPDESAVSDWARESMGWTVKVGIISGREDGTIQPGEPATRAEVAQMLMRYLNWQP